MNGKLMSLIATALLLIVPAWSYAETVVVRDRSGKVIERKITRGNRTEVRSPTGKLIRVETVKRDKKVIRTPSLGAFRN